MDSRAPTVDDLLRMAREDIARSSLSSAEKTLEQALSINTRSAEAYHLLGCVYSKRGKFKKATVAFQNALHIDPFFTEAAIALSSLFNDVGKYREGAAVFHQAKKHLDKLPPGHDPKINRTLAQRHHELGLLYMRFERFAEANHEFNKALNLDPGNVTISLQIAKCLAKLGDRSAAIAFLKQLIAQNPRFAEARIQLGILLHSQQQVREAQREWKDALALDPGNRQAQMYLNMVDLPSGPSA
jgi:tetratricopeptide (TPR) repeat protein